jgi:hypothetical protein
MMRPEREVRAFIAYRERQVENMKAISGAEERVQ